MKKKGTTVVQIDSAGAGDIVSMAGLANPSIGHTVANVEVRCYHLHSFYLKILCGASLIFSFTLVSSRFRLLCLLLNWTLLLFQ